jgi:hypothetical protein
MRATRPSRHNVPSPVRLLPEVGEPISRSGGVRSLQEAEVTLPAAMVRSIWRPENLERLARAYWRYLSRVSLQLLRVVYGEDSRTVVVLFRPFALLRFHAPAYATGPGEATVTWRIDRGLLVQRSRRGEGHLSIRVQRVESPALDDPQRLRVGVEVRNFYPWLRGSGRFARIGTWLYVQTQLRIHRLITHGFLRDLARLDLPPARVGALRGEIVGPRPSGQ